MLFFFKGDKGADEFYDEISVSPINLPLSEIIAYKRNHRVSVIAVRMEPDASDKPKAFIYPRSMIEKIEQQLRKRG